MNNYLIYYGSDTFPFFFFWVMFLEVMMTQFLKRTICKIDNWSNKYMENTESQKKRKRKGFQHQTSGTRMLIISFNFFNFAKKTITKEIIMGASVFISANGYICARMHVRVRAYVRAERRIRRKCAFFFFATCCKFVHTSLKKTPT